MLSPLQCHSYCSSSLTALFPLSSFLSLLSIPLLLFLAVHCSASPPPQACIPLLSLFCSLLFYSSSLPLLLRSSILFTFSSPLLLFLPLILASLLPSPPLHLLPLSHLSTSTIVCTFSSLLLLSSSLVLFIPSHRLQSSSLLSNIPFLPSSPCFAFDFPSTA